MLDAQHFEVLAGQWLARKLSGEEAQKSLASYFEQVYRHGVVDTSGEIRHITNQLSEIGILTNDA